jgi:hypothetical protein
LVLAGEFSQFANARQFGAWLGLVPSQNSAGGMARLGRITKRGDECLRTLLIQAEKSAVMSAGKRSDRISQWLVRLRQSAGWQKAVVALANKNARILWAVLTRDAQFDADHVPQPPMVLPERWVVDCKRLDHGDSVIVYLGRYLYRGVIQERDIVRLDDSGVTYRWRDSTSRLMRQRSVSGAQFLHLVLQHVLPRGLRRARSCGFLHPNARRLAALRKLLVFKTPQPPPGRARDAALRLLRRAHAHRVDQNTTAPRCDNGHLVAVSSLATIGDGTSHRRASLKPHHRANLCPARCVHAPAAACAHPHEYRATAHVEALTHAPAPHTAARAQPKLRRARPAQQELSAGCADPKT